MNRYLKMVFFGFVLWLIPFISGFFFVDSAGNFRISETFFKSIMIVISSLVGVFLAVKYFRGVDSDFVKEGLVLGAVWLVINLAIDLAFVSVGFFPMTVTHYFTDIGMRYLSMPIYTIGIGKVLDQK